MAYNDELIKAATLNIPWEKLDGCNILVTGATGLIGSCLIDILMLHPNMKYNVYASGRNENRAYKYFSKYINNPHFHFFKHDVQSPLDCRIEFQYIVHAASNASPNFFVSQPVEVILSNIDGVKNLMNYGIKHGLKRFVFVSTGEVYGEGDVQVFTEDYSGYVDCTKQRSCYPTSKRASENLCIAYSAEYGIETVIARPSHTYGPHFTESDNRVYAQFIRNVLMDQNIIMKSTGSQFRSWCYVVDCVSALLYIMLKGENNQAYNIADENSNISIKDLAEMIAQISGKKVVIELPTDTEKAGYNVITKSIFSTKKLRNLGWTINGTMRSKLESTIQERKRLQQNHEIL